GWTIDRVSNNLTGNPGTPVKVTMERGGQRHTYEITRAVISLAAVPFTTVLDGSVGYIPFSTSFSDRSARDVAQAVRTLQVQGGYPLPDGWVLKLTTAHWYTPSGRLIQRTRADSARPDSLRPKFRSASGRELMGGGGIVPDVVVGADTLSAGELLMARLLAA